MSITAVQGGMAHNVIPERVRMLGKVRSFSAAVCDALESGIKRVACGIAASMGALATRAAASVVGAEHVANDITPIMGSEDFVAMPAAKPGAYVFLGQAAAANSCMVHNPQYDFDDRLLPMGASYWLSLVPQELPLE
jgi:metal-dependent amidase/aminoacylase/carboxypeptidase family protein